MKSRLILAACVLAAASATAQTIKPGLWEMTGKVGGNPEMEKAAAQMQQQMASMPPAQRKQMEEMMAKQGVQMGTAGGGMSVKMCLTKEMVERNEFAGAQPGDCKTTSQPRVGNTMKMSFTCVNPPSSGEGEFTFMGTDGYHSKMKITSAARGKPETMTTESTGKWLGADCGAIKPIAPPKK
jgi:hypothetical protein